MKQLIVILSAFALVGCATKMIVYDQNGNIMAQLEGKHAVREYASLQALTLAATQKGPCDYSMAEVSKLSASGQTELFRSCYMQQTIAAVQENALTPVGEVAQYQAREDAARAAATSQNWATVGRVASLGIGLWGAAAIADSIASNAGHNSYTANGNTFSQSINGNSAGMGAMGEGEGVAGAPGGSFDASGSRTQSLVVGGDSNLGVIDQSPSAVLQPNQDIGEKPMAVDATGDFNNTDPDGNNNDTSLF